MYKMEESYWLECLKELICPTFLLALILYTLKEFSFFKSQRLILFELICVFYATSEEEL